MHVTLTNPALSIAIVDPFQSPWAREMAELTAIEATRTVIGRRVVRLAAREFTATSTQRAFETRRPTARKLRWVKPPPAPQVFDGTTPSNERTWQWSAMTLAFLALLVTACWAVS